MTARFFFLSRVKVPFCAASAVLLTEQTCATACISPPSYLKARLGEGCVHKVLIFVFFNPIFGPFIIVTFIVIVTLLFDHVLSNRLFLVC